MPKQVFSMERNGIYPRLRFLLLFNWDAAIRY